MKEWNFELLRDREGIHLRRGLTDLKASSVPVHRIQVVAVRQPLFWRLTGWWRVEVNIAGVGSRTDDSDAVVLPVGTPAEALRVIEVLGPFADPAAVVEGMAGDAHATAYVLAPRRAAWLSPLVRQRHGYAVTDGALLLRGGRLHRYVDLVPHARIQSLRQRQGPLQRLLGLASVQALSTPGVADPWVRHLGVQEATHLMNAQVSRSREARRPARR
jgi:putative membrane protein